MKKSWTQKLNEQKQPHVKRIDKAFADIPAESDMLIATPMMVDAYIRQIPSGKKVSLQTMRRDLAADNHAEYTCPVTSGIFLRIVAEAAFEQYQQTGAWEGITPFWRVVDPKSPLAKKLSFGVELLKERIDAEVDN